MKLVIQNIICLFLISNVAYAQNIKGAAIAGFNLTQVDGDQTYGFKKFGANLGASAIIPIDKRFSIALELLFSQKGSIQGPQDNFNDSTQEYRLNLNYAEIPLLFQYNDKGGFIFSGGFSYGRLVRIREKEFNPLTKSVEWKTIGINDNIYRKSDYEIIGDLRFRIFRSFFGNIRYAYSLRKIRTRDFFYPLKNTRHQFNNVITCRLIWIINEDYEPNSNIKP